MQSTGRELEPTACPPESSGGLDGPCLIAAAEPGGGLLACRWPLVKPGSCPYPDIHTYVHTLQPLPIALFTRVPLKAVWKGLSSKALRVGSLTSVLLGLKDYRASCSIREGPSVGYYLMCRAVTESMQGQYKRGVALACPQWSVFTVFKGWSLPIELS